MDASALVRELDNLEKSWSSLDWWLNFWSILVVVGVAVEVILLLIEYAHERREFKRGVIHSPEKPDPLLLLTGMLGAGLVAVGVAGEFRMHVRAGKVETEMRDVSRRQVSIAEREAKTAGERASANEKMAAQLEGENLKLRQTIQPRSLTLQQQRAIGDALRPFRGTYVQVWSLMHDPEGYFLGEEIVAAFRHGSLAVQDVTGKYTDSNGADVGVGIACPDAEQSFAKAVRKSLALIPFDHVALIKPRPLISDAGIGKSFQPAPNFCVVFVFSKPLPILK